MQTRIINARSEVPSECGTCGGTLLVGGPIWNERIHNLAFVERMLKKAESEDCDKGTKNRIKGILGGIIDEEWVAHKPLSYDMSQICSNLKCENPSKA